MAAPAKNSRLRVIAILLAVFALGGIAGAALQHLRVKHEIRETMALSPPEARARFRMRAMRRHLDLSDEQAAAIEKIFIEGAEKSEDLEKPCRPALDELRADINRRIDEILTPEQREKYQAVRDRRAKRRGR